MTGDQKAAVEAKGRELLALIDSAAGPSREASIARTKTEEAIMWAMKGIAAKAEGKS